LDLVGFEIAGADRVWYNADAEIDSKTNDILVSSPQVPNPVAVRYAFRNWPEGANVVTDYDMPLPPFRTDDWPIEKD
jgi:sialate O-acetylesterase